MKANPIKTELKAHVSRKRSRTGCHLFSRFKFVLGAFWSGESRNPQTLTVTPSGEPEGRGGSAQDLAERGSPREFSSLRLPCHDAKQQERDPGLLPAPQPAQEAGTRAAAEEGCGVAGSRAASCPSLPRPDPLTHLPPTWLPAARTGLSLPRRRGPPRPPRSAIGQPLPRARPDWPAPPPLTRPAALSSSAEATCKQIPRSGSSAGQRRFPRGAGRPGRGAAPPRLPPGLRRLPRPPGLSKGPRHAPFPGCAPGAARLDAARRAPGACGHSPPPRPCWEQLAARTPLLHPPPGRAAPRRPAQAGAAGAARHPPGPPGPAAAHLAPPRARGGGGASAPGAARSAPALPPAPARPLHAVRVCFVYVPS